MIAYVGCSRVLKGRVKERRKEKEQRGYQPPPPYILLQGPDMKLRFKQRAEASATAQPWTKCAPVTVIIWFQSPLGGVRKSELCKLPVQETSSLLVRAGLWTFTSPSLEIPWKNSNSSRTIVSIV